MMAVRQCGIACSIIKKEIEALQQCGEISIPFQYVDSRYHMRPAKLQDMLSAAICDTLETADRVVIVYGDCCPDMHIIAKDERVHRVNYRNCITLLLGDEEYRQQMRAGAFLVQAEWLKQWQTIFLEDLGLQDSATAKEMMRDMNKKLVYLDTGLEPIPMTDLEAFAAYVGLPWEILPVTLDKLKRAIQNELE